MNMPMIDVPKQGVSPTLDLLYGLHYPRLFLLHRSQRIPAVLRTEDVGHQAYNSMVNARRLVPVPPGADGVAESLERLFIKEYSTASMLAPVLFNICDSNNERYDPNAGSRTRDRVEAGPTLVTNTMSHQGKTYAHAARDGVGNVRKSRSLLHLTSKE
jgi:hypothetical protein